MNEKQQNEEQQTDTVLWNQRIMQERLERGWSRRDLADRIGVTIQSVSRWENARVFPRPEDLQRLMEIFEKDAKDMGFLESRRRNHTIMPLDSSSVGPFPPFANPLPRPIRLARYHMYFLILIGFVGLILFVIGPFIIIIFHALSPHLPADLVSHNLHLTPQYAKQMQVNQTSIVRVVLSSSKESAPLCAVNGSVVDGQSMPLGTLLGKQNTPCATASLVFDQTAFRVQPSQPQEYSLEQSQITWIWSVTPLRVDTATPQEIPVNIFFSGKSHCGSGEALTGPYPLAGNSSLLIRVKGPLSPPAQETPLLFPLLFSMLSVLLLAFLMWMSIFLWRRKRKKGRYTGKASETGSSLVASVSKPSISEMKRAQLDSQDRAERLGEPRQTERVQLASLREVQPEEARMTRPQRALASTSLSIFYCYAHEDKAFRDQLEIHLSPLQRSGHITNWCDGEIVPGTPWKEEITTRLNAAHLILLLISPDFVASDYCYSEEMTQALKRHQAGEASVIPIILRPVVWDGMPIANLQVLPKEGKPVSSWPNRDDAFFDVVQGIRVVVAALLNTLLTPN